MLLFRWSMKCMLYRWSRRYCFSKRCIDYIYCEGWVPLVKEIYRRTLYYYVGHYTFGN